MVRSASLRVLEVRYNAIGGDAVEEFVRMLGGSGSGSGLLFVEVAGNQVKRNVLDSL